jgi:hypothetical protein
MEKNEELRVPMAEHMVHMWHICPQQIQVKLLHQLTAVNSRYR